MEHNSTPVIILAGGFGTRLKSVLNDLPKPLADINGTPFLGYVFRNLIKEGFRDIILSLHYKAEKIIAYVEEEKKEILSECKVRYVVEETPMGTGGAIAYIVNKFKMDGSIFVVNADTWIGNGYADLSYDDGLNLIGAVQMENTARYGRLITDEAGFISQFIEKGQNEQPGLINAGVYKLNTNLFDNWDEKPFSIETVLFPQLIKQKILKVIKLNTGFIDIGIPQDYHKFCAMMLSSPSKV